MWNLRGTFALVLGPDRAGLATGLAYAGFAVAIVATAALWRGGWSRGGDRRDAALRFALTIVIGLLLSPHLNPHDDLVAVLAIALGYGALRGTRNGRVLAAGALLSPIAILIVNGIAADAPTVLPIRLPTVLLMGLAAILVVGLRARRGSPATA
jgi:high-affinity Fe2+/Pb2+ permease